MQNVRLLAQSEYKCRYFIGETYTKGTGGNGMENVRIIDLKVDNIVQFQAPFKGITAMQTAIVNHVYAKEKV